MLKSTCVKRACNAVRPSSAFSDKQTYCTTRRQQRNTAISTQPTLPDMSLPHGDIFFLDEFAARQWDDPNYSGTRIQYDKAEFVAKIHDYHQNGCPLVDGYAPFCKHVFVPNFVGAKVGSLKVTDDNKHLLRSAYTRRRPEELAVLTR